jgi:hypothetical protein
LQIDAGGSEGVALAEIYDASDTPATESRQIVNLSARGLVGSGDAALAAGFVVTGSLPKRVLIRGVGPSLAAFGVAGTVPDPTLKIYRDGTLIAQNDNWQTPQETSAATGFEIAAIALQAGAFAYAPDSKDAAVLLTLSPGAYTAVVSPSGATGAGMVEIYDVTGASR